MKTFRLCDTCAEWLERIELRRYEWLLTTGAAHDEARRDLAECKADYREHLLAAHVAPGTAPLVHTARIYLN